MKYALVLEKNSELCNNTLSILSSMGYLTTPVFSAKKALHAAHMIQFDLIITCTAVNPDDRRSLTGELKRCSPDALLLVLADAEAELRTGAGNDGVSAVLQRPLSAGALRSVLDVGFENPLQQPMPPLPWSERRRRAID